MGSERKADFYIRVVELKDRITEKYRLLLPFVRFENQLSKTKIMNNMRLKRLIVPSPYGFVQNKACVKKLLESLDIITDAVNKGNSVDLVLL